MFGISASIKAIATLIVILVLASGAWYVMNLKADLAVSEINNRTLQDGIREQQDLMARMQQDIRTIQETNQRLHTLNEEQRREVDTLSKKFSQDAKGQPRDFGALAAEKPELVERLVNRGAKNAMRCLEIASGAPRTEAELAAKTSAEINKECPAIANPNYKAPQ